MKKYVATFLLLLCSGHFAYCSDNQDLEFISKERGEFEMRRARLGMKQDARDGNSMSDALRIKLVFANHQRRLDEEVEEAREAALAELTKIKKVFDRCFPKSSLGVVFEEKASAPIVKVSTSTAVDIDIRRRRWAYSCDEEEKGDPVYGDRSPIPKNRKYFLECLLGALGLSSKSNKK